MHFVEQLLDDLTFLLYLQYFPAASLAIDQIDLFVVMFGRYFFMI